MAGTWRTRSGAQRQLHKIDAEQVVAVALAHAAPREAAAIADTFGSIAELVKSIVGALVPKAPPAPNELEQATMLARARTEVPESGDWMTAAEIACSATGSGKGYSRRPRRRAA